MLVLLATPAPSGSMKELKRDCFFGNYSKMHTCPPPKSQAWMMPEELCQLIIAHIDHPKMLKLELSGGSFSCCAAAFLFMLSTLPGSSVG